MCAATNSSDQISDLKNQRWNKLIVAGCIVIVAYYLHRFIVNKGTYSDPIVQIKNGRIRGSVGFSRGGREVYEFKGIPFGQALRFQSPKPIENWKGILNTRRFRPKCMQVDLISHLKSGSDDCLYLNVFMPKLKLGRNLMKQKPLPVIAFIHGGYYVSGHTSLYGPKYLLDEDIVLVTISYRLGALGFLNLGVKDARGNQGLKDQVLALKWIQDNIHLFGGDPNLVTIMGQSAGGSSVHFHMLSPKSKGLFHRAVSHSGTIQSPWAISHSGKEQALRLAKILDCPVNDSHASLDCLKKKDVNKIVEVHSESLYFLHDPLSVFKPTVEEIDDDDAFLTQDPLELMKAGNVTTRVPWIIGVNSEEGLAVASVLVRDNSLLQVFQKDWRTNFRNLLLYSTNDDSVPGKIRSYYFGSQSNFCTQSNLGNFTKMFSEREYFLGTHQSALYHHSVEKSSPVYLFYFAQPIPLSFGDVLWAQYGILPAFVEIGVYLAYAWIQRNIFGMHNPHKGVTHVDDLTMLFQIFNIPEYDADDGWNKLSKQMVKSWVEFARSGEPAPIFGAKWTHAFPKEKRSHSMSSAEHKKGTPVPQYLKITIDSPAMVDEPFNEAVAFWNSLNVSEYKGSVVL
ncbi:unnamed protein product [Orchesella dallaii]|uniref:Carboxylic ester hydrolase n=1 Tax=Orchesella dallaii TaxID=48710 RepID=A0ABP1RWT7_9HEXA